MTTGTRPTKRPPKGTQSPISQIRAALHVEAFSAGYHPTNLWADMVQAIGVLSGQWKLLYTVNSELTGLLGLSRLPGVEVGEISQTVNGTTLSIINTVTIGGPVSRTTFSAKAAFEIMSPKRIQVSLLLTH